MLEGADSFIVRNFELLQHATVPCVVSLCSLDAVKLHVVQGLSGVLEDARMKYFVDGKSLLQKR